MTETTLEHFRMLIRQPVLQIARKSVDLVALPPVERPDRGCDGLQLVTAISLPATPTELSTSVVFTMQPIDRPQCPVGMVPRPVRLITRRHRFRDLLACPPMLHSKRRCVLHAVADHGLQIADLDPQSRQFLIAPFQLTSELLDLGGMSLTYKPQLRPPKPHMVSIPLAGLSGCVALMSYAALANHVVRSGCEDKLLINVATLALHNDRVVQRVAVHG